MKRNKHFSLFSDNALFVAVLDLTNSKKNCNYHNFIPLSLTLSGTNTGLHVTSKSRKSKGLN